MLEKEIRTKVHRYSVAGDDFLQGVEFSLHI